jgi:hypothetical protein
VINPKQQQQQQQQQQQKTTTTKAHTTCINTKYSGEGKATRNKRK